MANLKFIVDKATKEGFYGVRVWDPKAEERYSSDQLSKLWEADGSFWDWKHNHEKDTGKKPFSKGFERARSFDGGTRPYSKFLASDGTLYLGLNTACFGSQHARIMAIPSEGGSLNIRELSGRVGFSPTNSNSLDANSVSGFFEHEGTVYDYGVGGLYRTLDSVRVNNRHLGYAGVVQGSICLVPWRKDITLSFEDQRGHIEERGSLVDLDSGEVVMQRITPFDGSGGSPGSFFIYGDVAYVSHGNHPHYKLTGRSLEDGRTVLEEGLVAPPRKTFAHSGMVFTLRETRGGKRGDLAIVQAPERSSPDASEEDRTLYRLGSSVTSIAPAGELGILVAKYDLEEDRSKIVSTEDFDKPLLESEGCLRIRRA